jgi:hypothetical protein
VTQRRDAQLGQGRSKGAASPARRGSAVGNRQPCGTRASSMGGFGAGEGNLITGWSGPVGALSFELLVISCVKF